ncbi:galactose oxidase-like domain-containing protein [Geodermatophilus amargosae]
MLLAYYPSAAISWVLGALNLTAFMLTGVGGLVVTAQVWLMLYVNSAVLHLGVYFWNRRHNVSPHEQEGSSGVAGMAMSAMSAPVYVQALSQALRQREPAFVVTRKGAVSGDHLGVFRRHLAWGALLVGVLVASVPLGHVHVAVSAWAVLSAVMCLFPVALLAGHHLHRPSPSGGRHLPDRGQHRPGTARHRSCGRRRTGAARGPPAGEPPMTRRVAGPLRRLRNAALVGAAVTGVVAANGPVVVDVADRLVYDFERNQQDYKQQYGFWETVELSEEYRLSAVHAALLSSGKVLLIAGSGNNAERFEAGTFRSIVWDPVTGDTKEVPTPEDLFCGGHAYLPNGNLLIAGGTRRYERLDEQVDRAAGVLSLTNEHDEPLTLPVGTTFTNGGLTYTSTEEVRLPAAHEMPDGSAMDGVADVWVEAEGTGDEYVVEEERTFGAPDLPAEHRGEVHVRGAGVTKDKQNFQGLDASYEFDVATETYRRTGRLDEARWYPTLIGLDGGRVLAVSGLDEYGRILPGDNELYDPATRTWTDQPDLFRYFPTFPALFRLADGRRVFYSGSNTGYGPAEAGRQPGIWDVSDNSWQDVHGLEDAEYNETSASFFLAPVQDQRVGIVGGGLVGDSPESTTRFNVVDLDGSVAPRYEPAPDYPSPVRYLNAVTLPDDTTLLTGGSEDYRGNEESDLHLTTIYDPETGTLDEAAPNFVGRNYHATALLLPDGRVMTMGSDPLFADAEETRTGTFDTRIEIYSPPYLFADERPAITGAPEEISRGSSFSVDVEGTEVAEARLLRPSAVTHQTDTEQRSVALDVRPASCPEGASGHTTADGGAHCPDGCCGSGTVELTVPEEEGLTPSGWYTLVVLDSDGVPSPARWVHVA